MSEDWVAALPEHLRDRPVDERRKVPVPYMNTMTDGTVDFTGISAAKAYECGRERLCGICHKPLDYWIAFIGGPMSTANRTYTDPPFHGDCARAAMEFCPHIKVRNHRRTPEERRPEDSWASPNATPVKPGQWIIGYTRNYAIVRAGAGFVFHAASIHHRDTFMYDDDGNLKEVKQ